MSDAAARVVPNVQHLRVARATRDLDPLVRFYRETLGFNVIGEFREHRGFDGVMLAFPGCAWHLEFTVDRNADESDDVQRRPSDDVLVLYLTPVDYERAVERALRWGASAIRAHNPYWDEHGTTLADPDGNRIVLHCGTWDA